MNQNKFVLIEQLVRRLQSYNGRTDFTDDEFADIMECTSLLEELDPNHEHVKIGDIDFGIKHTGKVIPFRKKE